MNSSNNNKNLEKPLVVSYLRWSTGKQKLGDSERRQLDSAEEWLNENGYEVNEDFILKDDGKSGYHSENFSDEGALGKFIAKVKEGKIPKGTILLIEDFSRFSRAQINLAQQRFLELINNDIRVYIVKDKKLYQKESYTLEDMIVSLAKMAAAHEESDRKSNHLKKFWAARRKVAGENKNIDEYPLLLPSTVPDWIKKVKKGSQTYLELIPERVEVIKYIFELADTGGKDGLGLGSSIIVRKLENEGIKPFKGERKNTAITFTDSYVVRLLKDRRLLGFLQPYKNPIDPNTGKRIRIKDGDEIANYFPPVIDEETFERVREKIEQRKRYSSGKVSRKFSNLFTKIVKCAFCGHSMTMFTKRGSRAEGGRSVYLQCSEGTKHRKCGNKSVRYYDTFELTIINTLIEIDLTSLFQPNNEHDDNNKHKLREQIYELTKQIEELESTIINATEMCFKNPEDKFFKQTRAKLINEQSDLKVEVEDLNLQLFETGRKSNYEELQGNLEAVVFSQNLEDDIETYTMRKSINTHLIDIIQYIAVDGVKQEAWVVFDLGYATNRIKKHLEIFRDVMLTGDTEFSFELSPRSIEDTEAFGDSSLSPHIKIKLKRFKDRRPTDNDIVELRLSFAVAPKELVKINNICNKAINRNWKSNKRAKYRVLDSKTHKEINDKVTSDFFK